jgi:5-formyltetrahydrofolate cyclo-ligase
MRSLPTAGKCYRDAQVNQYLMKTLRKEKGKRILFYWPFGFESDIRKTIWSVRRHKTLYLPFMDGESFKMVPFRLPLERKAFGIYEPRFSNLNIKIIDVAIVPVVGVDGSFCRIGFGKGMYDRFFPTLKSKPLTIFIQSHLCLTAEKVCDDYDISGDLLITPHGVNSNKESRVKRTTYRGRCHRS